jgi:hypothetical protein
MDKSPEYMVMCAKATRLQCTWQPARGDVYTVDMKTTDCWLTERPAVAEIRRGFGITRQQDGLVRISRMIWLPRLDQLMSLAQRPPASFDRVTQAFFAWCERDRPPWGAPKNRFRSLEQMWLSFVMLCRFHQHWEDTDGWQGLGRKGAGEDS